VGFADDERLLQGIEALPGSEEKSKKKEERETLDDG